jgi:hypothetical protein
LSSGIVTYVSIGAGGAAVLVGLAGWLRTRAEVVQLQRQQAQSKRMVIPPSVSDVERYSGAKLRLRLLRRRTRLCFGLAGLGIVAVIAGVFGAFGTFGAWSGRGAAAPVAQPPPIAEKPAAPVVQEVDHARQLLVSLGKLCRTERRRCSRQRKDIGPIVASVCHFHPELCTAEQFPAGLTAPSARDQAAAPRVPRPVLQALVAKVGGGTLTWDDLQLALP